MQVRINGPDVAADLDACSVGQAPVKHRDIRVQGRDTAGGLGGGSGLAHHFETLILQQVPQTLPDELVVVEDEHAYRAALTCCAFWSR